MAEQVDILKRWFAMKARIIKQQGPYLFADGTVARIGYRGQPLTTFAQAEALDDVWTKVAWDLFERLGDAGKGSKRGPLLDAIQQFRDRQIRWFLFVSKTYGSSTFKGKYLFLPATDQFYQNLGHFISAVNSATNWAFTAKMEWELLGEAINETPGGWLLKPFYYGVEYTNKAIDFLKEMAKKTPEFFNDAGDALQTIITMMKWGSITGGLYLLYGALKPKKAGQ